MKALKISLSLILALLLIILICFSILPLCSYFINMNLMKEHYIVTNFSFTTPLTLQAGYDALLSHLYIKISDKLINSNSFNMLDYLIRPIFNFLFNNIIPFYFGGIIIAALLTVIFSKKNFSIPSIYKPLNIISSILLALIAIISFIIFVVSFVGIFNPLGEFFVFFSKFKFAYGAYWIALLLMSITIFAYIINALFFLGGSLACILLIVYMNVRSKSACQISKSGVISPIISLIGSIASSLFATHCIANLAINIIELISFQKHYGRSSISLIDTYISYVPVALVALILIIVALAFLLTAIKDFIKPKAQKIIEFTETEYC